MTTKQIEAIGYFLAYYRNDLLFINHFQMYKKGNITSEEYVNKIANSFYKFLVEFRVIRNVVSGEVYNLLNQTTSFIESFDNADVDNFALILSRTDLTRNNIVASMASKILFLNNPYEIIPMDSLARNTLKQKLNKYNIYMQKLDLYKEQNADSISEMIEYVKPFTDIIHRDFPLISDLEVIAKNRLIDKLLWTSGRK